MPKGPAYSGPALFSHGFRPFFLSAAFFGGAVIPVWLMVWTGHLVLGGPFLPVDWHVHEMLFGYAGAVIAGFLFTAVPNWTGRMPIRGWPLMALTLLWLLGRFGVAGVFPAPPLAVAVLDCGFLMAITTMIATEIVAGRNWRNLKVVIPVLLFFVANVLFHVETMATGTSIYGRHLGMAVVIFLITLIGGRIIPSFTRNWLAKRRATRLPTPFGKFDGICILAGGVALLVWTVRPEGITTACLLGLAGLLHLVRLTRWRGEATWRSPILLMLHIAYLFVSAGMLATGLSAAGLVPVAVGMHLFGIGGIGGMTVAVMMRATLGHTGRSLDSGAWLTGAFCLIMAAAVVRALVPTTEVAGLDGIALAAGLWTLGFGILAIRLTQWLTRPSPARRQV